MRSTPPVSSFRSTKSNCGSTIARKPWLLFIRGHGLAVHSRQTDCVYLLTAYGLICLAKGKGIDKELPLIIVPPGAGEVTHGA